MFNFTLDSVGLVGEKGGEQPDGEGTFTDVEGFPLIRDFMSWGTGLPSGG